MVMFTVSGYALLATMRSVAALMMMTPNPDSVWYLGEIIRLQVEEPHATNFFASVFKGS